MPVSARQPRSYALPSNIAGLVLVTSIVAVAYFAREILLPFALAILLSFLLAPLARRFEKWRLGRVGSVVLAVSLAFSLLGVTGWIVTRQALQLASNISEYEEQLKEKVRSLRPSEKSAITEMAETVKDIEEEFEADETPEESPSGAGIEGTVSGEESGRTLADELTRAFSAKPLPVQVIDTTFMPVRLLRDASPVLSSLGSLAITIVFVIFMLLQREDLRDRLIRLAGTSRVYLTTQALDDAGRRVSRYLLMQLVINGTYGLAVAVGLYFIGLPNAVLWGLLAMLLRFLPYVGPIVGALTPIALSLAVFPGWTRPLITAGMFIVLELVSNNIVEPWLYGTSTGVSTLGIIVAAVFWTWLWGPVGLVLATPLTVCVTVMARHVPQFHFLNILLADEPPLATEVRFYQRLLAGDYDDAADIVTEFLSTEHRERLGDAILLPALTMAERDRDAGHLSEERENFAYESMNDLIDDLDQLEGSKKAPQDAEAESEESAPPAEGTSSGARRLNILCLAAEDAADYVGARLLAKLLEMRGQKAHAAYAPVAGEELPPEMTDDALDCIVISTIAPGRGAWRARRVCLHLHRRYPDARLIVGLWHPEEKSERARDRFRKTGADFVTNSLESVLEEIESSASETAPPAETGVASNATDAAAKADLPAETAAAGR